MNPEFWSGAFAALACVCIGGLIVFVLMAYREPDAHDPLEELWEMPSPPSSPMENPTALHSSGTTAR